MKQQVKTIAHVFCKLFISPLAVLYRLMSLKAPNDSLFCSLGQFLALFPGKAGSYLRAAFYSTTIPNVSQKIHIDFGSYFAHPEADVAPDVYIGAYCIIGKCTIGSNSLIGSCVNILSGNRQHQFTDPNQPIRQQGGHFTRITIGENCWIGNNSVIMADIGDRTVIGAGSIVVKKIPSDAVAVGNPCKTIKEHKETLTNHNEITQPGDDAPQDSD